MKKGFFSRLAVDNIGKNRRFFIPHILTEAGLFACFYVVLTLYSDDRLASVHGGEYIPFFMSVGLTVISVLAVVLMLYSNSFLMKQRKREFGLYGVLGMEKKHIGKVLFGETAISNLIAIGGGLVIGILLYKLCSVIICSLLDAQIIAGVYYLSADTILISVLVFAVFDIIVYLADRTAVAKMKPVDLLSSGSAGEREPKIKWPLLITGIACLAGGYYLSVSVQSPLAALYFFFLAVVLVVAGTYCIFVSGSIFVLKMLKKNRKYYYSSGHMTNVSGLMYRMKHNAVGLASIALLATCVLVMISSTVSLYSGMQQTIDGNYPQHLYVSAEYIENGVTVYHVPSAVLKDITESVNTKHGLETSGTDENNYLDVAFCYDGESYTAVPVTGGFSDELASRIVNFTVLTQDEYEKITGEKLNLAQGEAALAAISTNWGNPGIGTGPLDIAGVKLNVTQMLPSFPIQNALISITTCYGLVVPDDAAMQDIYDMQKSMYGDHASDYSVRVAVTYDDYDSAVAAGDEIQADIDERVKEYIGSSCGGSGTPAVHIDTRWDARSNIYGMYGTLLFLGVILGIVFMFATVLIIYYKQISEGYDDRARFQIMKKIGMSDREVRRTINRQIIYVFFIPLAAAAVNILFAFPMLNRLLHVLLLSSTWLFAGCTLITFGGFALLYILIYSLTARTYYKIVK